MATRNWVVYLTFLADQLIAGFVLAPLVVSFWRGTWLFSQRYFFPDHPGKSAWTSFAIGNGGVLLLALFQLPLFKLVKRDSLGSLRDFTIWLFLYHSYNFVLAFCAISMWRGTWDLWNFYTGTEPWSNACCLAIGLGLLLLSRTNKNAMGAPVLVTHDTDPEFFIYSTRCRTKPSQKESFIWDCILTVFGVHNLVVFYWRGTWQLMDNYWFPDDPAKTVWMSFAVGYGIYLTCIPLQLAGHLVYKKLSMANFNKFFMVPIEDVVFVMGNFATVAIWRAIWYGCDQHIWPDDPAKSIVFCLWVGILGLWLLRCGHSIIPRGCFIDGDAPETFEGASMFPNLYIRQFIKEISDERVKKRQSSVREASSVIGTIETKWV